MAKQRHSERGQRPNLGRGDPVVRRLPGCVDARGMVLSVKPGARAWIVEWIDEADGMAYQTSANAIERSLR